MSTRPRRPAPATPAPGKVSLPELDGQKASGTPIVMITAYDATFSAIVDAAGVDVILVGDSVATVIQGESNTLPVSMEEMAYHVRLVKKASPKALIVGDLPFGSYQVNVAQAVENSVRLIKAGAQAVKLEGTAGQADVIAGLVGAGIPVMGHVGLRPQAVHQLGGYRMQRDAEQLAADAAAAAAACSAIIELTCALVALTVGPDGPA